MPKTLSEKIWEQHVVHRADGEPDLSTSTSTSCTRSRRPRRSTGSA